MENRRKNTRLLKICEKRLGVTIYTRIKIKFLQTFATYFLLGNREMGVIKI